MKLPEVRRDTLGQIVANIVQTVFLESLFRYCLCNFGAALRSGIAPKLLQRLVFRSERVPLSCIGELKYSSFVSSAPVS